MDRVALLVQGSRGWGRWGRRGAWRRGGLRSVGDFGGRIWRRFSCGILRVYGGNFVDLSSPGVMARISW